MRCRPPDLDCRKSRHSHETTTLTCLSHRLRRGSPTACLQAVKSDFEKDTSVAVDRRCKSHLPVERRPPFSPRLEGLRLRSSPATCQHIVFRLYRRGRAQRRITAICPYFGEILISSPAETADGRTKSDSRVVSCDWYSAMKTTACPSCGNDLALFLKADSKARPQRGGELKTPFGEHRRKKRLVRIGRGGVELAENLRARGSTSSLRRRCSRIRLKPRRTSSGKAEASICRRRDAFAQPINRAASLQAISHERHEQVSATNSSRVDVDVGTFAGGAHGSGQKFRLQVVLDRRSHGPQILRKVRRRSPAGNFECAHSIFRAAASSGKSEVDFDPRRRRRGALLSAQRRATRRRAQRTACFSG